MDLSMPEVDGLTATRRITGDPRLASVRVVVLTTFDDEEHVFGALRAGASGFLVKDVEPEELLQGVRVVARADSRRSRPASPAHSSRRSPPGAPMPPRSRRRPAEGPTRQPPATRPGTRAGPGARSLARPGASAAPHPGIGSLTEREREVVGLVAAALSNDDIVAKLVVSPLTAKTHVSRAMIKLDARDRAQLVVIAYEQGLAEPGGR